MIDYDSDSLMPTRTIVCPECGLKAREVLLDDKFTLRFDVTTMQDRCTETDRSLAPFLCPYLRDAAKEAGIELGTTALPSFDA